jgi:hypothetical protein
VRLKRLQGRVVNVDHHRIIKIAFRGNQCLLRITQLGVKPLKR